MKKCGPYKSIDPEPSLNEPPWIHTITGRFLCLFSNTYKNINTKHFFSFKSFHSPRLYIRSGTDNLLFLLHQIAILGNKFCCFRYCTEFPSIFLVVRVPRIIFHFANVFTVGVRYKCMHRH